MNRHIQELARYCEEHWVPSRSHRRVQEARPYVWRKRLTEEVVEQRRVERALTAPLHTGIMPTSDEGAMLMAKGGRGGQPSP